MHGPHGEETGEVLLLVPHHHAVAHEVPQLGLDLLLDGVGGDVLPPAGDDHVLDAPADCYKTIVNGCLVGIVDDIMGERWEWMIRTERWTKTKG